MRRVDNRSLRSEGASDSGTGDSRLLELIPEAVKTDSRRLMRLSTARSAFPLSTQSIFLDESKKLRTCRKGLPFYVLLPLCDSDVARKSAGQAS